jgi:cytochrome b subunit of formate dehydrogenase
MENKDSHIKRKTDEPECKICFVRMNYSERMQHLIFMVCFFVLAITGFMAKTPEELVNMLGKAGEAVFYWRGILHRIAGIVITMVSLYHIYFLIFTDAGHRWLADMKPGLRDLKDIAANIKYYLGIKDSPPEFDRFTYKHKIEYFALIIGSILMTVTGIILWLESRWSKFILDIGILIHSMEAILACLAVVVWHFYEVHIRPGKSPTDITWFTGVIDEHEMKEEYLLHYKKIMEDPELQKIYIERKEK